MRRWERRLARLLRALIACAVLLCAAQGSSALVQEPVRDVSAWLACNRVSRPASPRIAQPAPAPELRRAAQQLGLVPRAPQAARAAADRRYAYLDLLTLRC